MKSRILTMFVLALLYCNTSLAAPTMTSEQLTQLQHQWAKVNYELDDKAQIKGFEELLETATALTQAEPDNAEYWVWRGIIESSFAGAKGGLGALSLAKSAKHSLTKAIRIDGSALMGSAYTSLGTLYHKVPGWPISFGDDKDARMYLEKALIINPEGIDPNYFFGEFLYDDHQYQQAKKYLLIAQQAPAREDRPLADKYRQQEITDLISKVDKKLNKK
ncbi:tetratricopeptide repeat protein [Thalassotalea mangrovi]|uniref:Tetratricopeptide repeat protein n=1 Tax=Thalassotalea mangrovi TaxID=2572245 RepID=A0A4U1B561_9GAMM|nr:hypothetical protein [Thalassotalea mangrovi]TKB45447.1 hypothetical protein E8M12_08505 [Thalassotalea mangrovi]